MKNKRKIPTFIIAVLVVAFCSTAYAATRINAFANKGNTQQVKRIEWEVPDSMKYADTVTQYDITMEETLAQFDPKAYIMTQDDNLTNYASPILSGWSNVSDVYQDYGVPDFEYNSKTLMRFQEFGYDAWNKQSALSRGSSAYTGNYCLRMVDDRYLVALGTYYKATIGQYLDIALEDGTIIPCILGDVKSDRDTDENNQYQKYDKSVMEFIVDSPIVSPNSGKYDYFRSMTGIKGNMSDIPMFNSKIAAVRIYDKVFDIKLGDTSNDNPDQY